MKFQTLAWMTRVVAQGNTTMARAILRPRNWLLRISASTKPSTVDSTTTAMVHTRVFCSTRPKAEPLTTLMKLPRPLKPLILPALLTSLRDIWNTDRMGTRIKMPIRITLGAIQMYGSILRRALLAGEMPLGRASLVSGLLGATLFTGTPPYSLSILSRSRGPAPV